MKKTVNQSQVGTDVYKYTVKLEGEECPESGPQSRMQAQSMLSTIASNLSLTDCGNNAFQTLRMRHDGGCWVIELEAVGS